MLVTRLAQQARWRLDRPDAKPTGIASAVPKGGVPITFSDGRASDQRGSTGIVNAGCSTPPSISMILPVTHEDASLAR